ncbi:Gfo/Idh/MocA family protein [Streptomyces sp. Ru87]|uniref:Gfo/Idh/MocA family protein n=1 Tax=Streptomyces sp. Ru87 TaxID=2044307 RepID=UPI0026BC43B3|nr:Gfo/Idh/MocA family oxidoreductase [Streptomyces sp. Ru87]
MADAYPAPLSRGEVGWGVLATGGIAHAFTRDLITHGHRVAAVGSRSADSARAFAGRWGIERAHGSYEELVADPDVDIVYVATPHNFHAANATAALESGKHVLVEKAFTVNAAEARAVDELARGKGLLAMEAMWTRFLPHMAYVRSVIERGLVGDIRSLHADHTQLLPADPAHRLNNRALAGGCPLDLGVYPVSFAHDILGDPVEVTGRGTLRDTGTDGGQGAGTVRGAGDRQRHAVPGDGSGTADRRGRDRKPAGRPRAVHRGDGHHGGGPQGHRGVLHR